MRLPFTKMHGLGNDFVVINAIDHPVEITAERARFLGDRRFGVGCDQILIVEPSERQGIDFGYRIFNSDGGEVEQCGNGARCFARFVRDQGLTDKTEISVETVSGIIRPKVRADGQVSVDMGAPIFNPADIPFLATEQQSEYPLTLANESLVIGAASMGNPHAVTIVADVDNADVETRGPEIEHHPLFPQRVNAGFMQILNSSHIRLRVYERGAGETLACGTGACAAVVVGIVQGHLDHQVRVSLRGGDLEIEWSGGDSHVMMTGPAETVFEGAIDL